MYTCFSIFFSFLALFVFIHYCRAWTYFFFCLLKCPMDISSNIWKNVRVDVTRWQTLIYIHIFLSRFVILFLSFVIFKVIHLLKINRYSKTRDEITSSSSPLSFPLPPHVNNWSIKIPHQRAMLFIRRHGEPIICWKNSSFWGKIPNLTNS